MEYILTLYLCNVDMIHALSKCDQFIFNPDPDLRTLPEQIFRAVFLVSLFSFGVIHWLVFLQFGNVSFSDTTTDWPAQLIYYQALTTILYEPAIPYFIAPLSGPAGHYFLGNPEIVLSPQIVLLAFMDVGSFVLINTLIMYTIGFFGCLVIRKHYHLSPVPFLMLFLLFNMNGHITSHISAGHSMWNGYFLLPFFLHLVIQLFNRERSHKTPISIPITLVLFAIILQGSFHIFNWCLVFLALIGLFNRQLWKQILYTIVLTVGLSLFRLVPAAMVLSSFKASYASGYPTFGTFLDSMTTIKAFTFEHVRIQGSESLYDVGWWEHDAFIGYVGLTFVLFFGVYKRFSKISPSTSLQFRALDLPIIVMVLLAFGFWVDIVSDLKIPIVSYVERVPSRFFIIPLLTLILIACIRMQAIMFSINKNTLLKSILLAGIAQLAHSLLAHSWFWKLNYTAHNVQSYVPNVFSINGSANTDIHYILAVNISAVISSLAFLSLLTLLLKGITSNRSKLP